MGLDLTRLCWCVGTADAAIVSKPQSDCRVFVSLTGLDWTRLDSVGVYTPSGLTGGLGFQKFPDSRHMKVVRLSAVGTGRIYTAGNNRGAHLSLYHDV